MRRWIVISLLLWTIPLSAKEKKQAGQVLDNDAFKSIQTYCVNTEALYGLEADATNRVMKDATKPKGVLGGLPWKLLPGCTGADAVVGIQFKQDTVTAQSTLGGSAAGAAISNTQDTFFEAALTVTREPGDKVVYQVQGARAPNSREEALRKSFKLLDQDVKRISE